MRTLHVAAMPYPSSQGTQALIRQMLSALCAAGHETHLLCYAQAASPLAAPAYAVHRVPALWARSGRARARALRSGPSLAKLLQDALLARSLAECIATLRPDAVIAHHVEAALAALAARARPLVFVAHTSLAHELPSYFPRLWSAPIARAGGALDRGLCRSAARVLAVSPLLAEELRARGAPDVSTIHVPWPLSAPFDAAERSRARRTLGLGHADEVVLYAGNLDAYQGLAPLLAGLERLARERPALRLLLATASEARGLQRSLRHGALGARLRLADLAGKAQRRALHAAADVVVVPRASPGGIPVKLLDALARGSHVIAARCAPAGLPLAAACRLVDGADPEAWRVALAAHFCQPIRALSSSSGRAHLARDHSPARFATELVRHLRALPGLAPQPGYLAGATGDIVPSSGHREGDTFS
jgi:glycosyltransferase involved in cell wall biosynthesis